MCGLLFDGVPVPVGAKYNGEQLSLGPAPGNDIPFIEWKGIYVATKCACVKISWEDLNKHGFIFGQAVWIDGNPYLCRSLKVGVKEGVPNEWDALLDAFGEVNSLWHWKDQYFWGQEKSFMWLRMLRGYNSARRRNDFIASYRDVNVGFRPVLEPLPPEPQVSDAMVGQNIKVYGNNGSVTGRLIGYDDYDLELEADVLLPDTCTWAKHSMGAVFINRESVTYLRKEE